MVWFSPDGVDWHTTEIEEIIAGVGAVEVAATIHQGYEDGSVARPADIIIVGADQAHGGPVIDPEWWVGQLPD